MNPETTPRDPNARRRACLEEMQAHYRSLARRVHEREVVERAEKAKQAVP